jgi:uncharacterized membrane protein YdbT with pleckstrin-like domain
MLDLKHLPNQREFEKTLFSLRRHWIVPVAITFVFLILVAIPIIFYYLVQTTNPTLIQGPVSWPLFVVGLSAYGLAIWLFYFNSLIDYYLDVWIVTNERIIVIEQKGLFSRTIAELKLYRVQDIKAEVSGIIPTLFDFGNITIQTAAEEVHFAFKQVPKPYKISRKILEVVEQDREKHLEEFKSEQTGV